MEINKAAQEMHDVAVEKGWYDPPKSFGEKIAMIHSEASEALEAGRSITEDLFNRYWYEIKVPRIDQLSTRHLQLINRVNQVNGTLLDGLHPSFEEMHELASAGIAKPEGVAVELADVVIRVMDTCVAYGIDLEQAIMHKASYNRTRPHRHGGKSL